MQFYIRLTKIIMHTRIKEFTERSTVFYDDGSEMLFNKEKFAELIVMECANIAEKISGKMKPEMVADMLRMHFGIDA